jgi:hypothetical protein
VLQPDHYNFVVREGATWRSVFTLYQSDTTGPVVDLTGASAQLEIKDEASGAYTTPSSSALLTLTNGNGLTIDGPAGTIEILQTATQTAAYTWASGDYRLTLTLGDTSVLLYGSVTIERF